MLGWQPVPSITIRQPRIPIQTEEEYQMIDKLRQAYGKKSIGALCMFLLTRECLNMTLVKNNLERLKDSAEGEERHT